MVKITWFLSFSGKNDAESLCHFVKTYFWTRNVRNFTKTLTSVMSGPAKTCPGGQVLTANQRTCFLFFRFYKIIGFTEQVYHFLENHRFYWINLSFFIKSSVLLREFIIFIKSSVLRKEFISFYKINGFTIRIYHFLSWAFLGN